MKLISISVVLRCLLTALILLNLAPNTNLTEIVVVSGHNPEINADLQAKTDEFLALFDRMPPVSVYLKDEPILKSGTNTERGVAYTNCEKGAEPIVYIKKIFYEKANRKQLDNILKHELTHAWLCRQNLSAGHDHRFRAKFIQVGGFGN